MSLDNLFVMSNLKQNLISIQRKWVTYAKYNKLICDTVTTIGLLSNYDLQDFPELRNIILFESESCLKNFNWGQLL